MATNQVRTIEEDFNAYFAACYKYGASALQKVEVRQAFLAGVITAMDKPGEWATAHGTKDVTKLRQLAQEQRDYVEAALEDRARQMEQRN